MSDSAAIDSLPDELLLETLQYLSCIPSRETQSSAFKNKTKEIARQCENSERRQALYSLCLTSQRLRRIALPLLYASFTSSTTWHGSKILRLFHRTILSPENGTSLEVRLGNHLKYVENRFWDHLGNNLPFDCGIDGAESMIQSYFRQLADIIHSAPNLQHVSVVSLETTDISLWKHILSEGMDTASTKVVCVGLQSLRSLAFQIHHQSSRHGARDWFHPILSAMASVPTLTDVRASGVASSLQPINLSRSRFCKLQRLNITECLLHFDEVIKIWTACENLRHITCVWAYLNCIVEGPSDLYEALLQHRTTLETLHLDLRQVRFDDAFNLPQKLGTLRPFTALDTILLCETTLLGNIQPLIVFPDQLLGVQSRISEFLPASVKSFALLLLADKWGMNGDCLDASFSSWHFVDDCKRCYSQLKEVSVKSVNILSAPDVTTAFRETGIQFKLIKERDVGIKG
jgi:hypothetical protein